MVSLKSYMVVVTAMAMSINALDHSSFQKIKEALKESKSLSSANANPTTVLDFQADTILNDINVSVANYLKQLNIKRLQDENASIDDTTPNPVTSETLDSPDLFAAGFLDLINDATNFLRKATGEIYNLGGDPIGAATGLVGDVSHAASGAVDHVVEGAKDILDGLIDLTANIVNGLTGGIFSDIFDAAKKAVHGVTTVGVDLANGATDIVDVTVDIAKSLLDGTADALVGNFGGVIGNIAGLAGDLAVIAGGLGGHSDSFDSLSDLTDGLDGLGDFTGGLTDNFDGLGNVVDNLGGIPGAKAAGNVVSEGVVDSTIGLRKHLKHSEIAKETATRVLRAVFEAAISLSNKEKDQNEQLDIDNIKRELAASIAHDFANGIKSMVAEVASKASSVSSTIPPSIIEKSPL